jgi:hypothetical protein
MEQASARRARRRAAAAAAVVTAIVAGMASLWTASAVAAPVATLDPGEHVFWDGPHVEQATVGAAEACAVVGSCWDYGIDVRPGRAATRLRVAIDWPSSLDMYALELYDPKGRKVGSMSGYGSWSDELFASKPAPGRWTVRVIPEDVSESAFQARAKLERVTPRSRAARTKPVLPNLRVNAPWDPTLVGPAGVGPTTLVIHRPADVLGFHPLSCSVDEMALNGTRRCLRFSVGPMNTGRGPFEVEMDLGEARPNEGGHLEGPVRQRLYRPDGRFTSRSAGTFVAHEQHAHFHAQDLLEYELLRVTDMARGQLEPTGVGNKASFCTLDLMIPFFDAFTTEGPKVRGASPCAVPPEGDTKLVMGISPGWADVYTWDLPDQYVDFGNGGEGVFVIRATVDPPNTVLETREDDNQGYALVRVANGEVELLERGMGSSPWDPRKEVLPLQP